MLLFAASLALPFATSATARQSLSLLVAGECFQMESLGLLRLDARTFLQTMI